MSLEADLGQSGPVLPRGSISRDCSFHGPFSRTGGLALFPLFFSYTYLWKKGNWLTSVGDHLTNTGKYSAWLQRAYKYNQSHCLYRTSNTHWNYTAELMANTQPPTDAASAALQEPLLPFQDQSSWLMRKFEELRDEVTSALAEIKERLPVLLANSSAGPKAPLHNPTPQHRWEPLAPPNPTNRDALWSEFGSKFLHEVKNRFTLIHAYIKSRIVSIQQVLLAYLLSLRTHRSKLERNKLPMQ